MEAELTDLLAQLRVALNDTDSPPLMTDETLIACINAGIRMATTEVPFDEAEDYTTDGCEYDLPALCVKVYRVKTTVSGVVTFWAPGGHSELSGCWTTGDEPQVILVHFPTHGKFYLPYEPSEDFTLYYAARREELESGDAIDLGTEAWMQYAILAFAAYYAFNPRSAFRADLEQWAMKIDLNVGNPLEREANRWLREYQRILQTFAQPSVFEVA